MRDADGEVWARFPDDEVFAWSSPGWSDFLLWPDLTLLRGPLEVIQPATDAEPEARPFNPGDHVRIVDRTRGGLVRRGRVVVNACSQRPVGPDERVVKIPCFPPEFHVAKIADLTHADADGERP